MGNFRSAAAFTAGHFAMATLLSDPRRILRRIVAAGFFILALVMLYVIPLSEAASADRIDRTVAGTSSFGLFWIVIGLVATSKFATRYPFSVFRYGQYVLASISTSRAAQVWWGTIAAGYAATILCVFFGFKGAVTLSVTATVVAMVGAGVSAVRVENNIVALALYVRTEVARALGVHPDVVDVANTGSLRKAEYTCRFPMLITPEQALAVERDIQQLLADFEIIGLENDGVSLIRR